VAKRALFICIKNTGKEANPNIPDPARGGVNEFRKVRELLAERVRRMVAT
jgi:hypothetical protein